MVLLQGINLFEQFDKTDIKNLQIIINGILYRNETFHRCQNMCAKENVLLLSQDLVHLTCEAINLACNSFYSHFISK